MWLSEFFAAVTEAKMGGCSGAKAMPKCVQSTDAAGADLDRVGSMSDYE